MYICTDTGVVQQGSSNAPQPNAHIVYGGFMGFDTRVRMCATCGRDVRVCACEATIAISFAGQWVSRSPSGSVANNRHEDLPDLVCDVCGAVECDCTVARPALVCAACGS